MSEIGTTGLRVPETVHVTLHVVDQLRTRSKVFARTDRRTLEKMIKREVSEAIRAGRVARRQPRFTLAHDVTTDLARSSRGRRGKGRHGTRYTWEAGRKRCYVTKPITTRDGRRGVAVITVYGTYE